MLTNQVVKILEQERTRLDKAIALLRGSEDGAETIEKQYRTVRQTYAKHRRSMTPEARKKIGDAQRARWAKNKKAAKSEA